MLYFILGGATNTKTAVVGPVAVLSVSAGRLSNDDLIVEVSLMVVISVLVLLVDGTIDEVLVGITADAVVVNFDPSISAVVAIEVGPVEISGVEGFHIAPVLIDVVPEVSFEGSADVSSSLENKEASM